jgi:hypothetical protein
MLPQRLHPFWMGTISIPLPSQSLQRLQPGGIPAVSAVPCVAIVTSWRPVWGGYHPPLLKTYTDFLEGIDLNKKFLSVRFCVSASSLLTEFVFNSFTSHNLRSMTNSDVKWN